MKHDELVKALRCYSACRKGEISELTADAAAAIETLEAAQPHWVSVEDELPQNGEMVMIYDGAIGFGCQEKGAWEWVDTFESGPAKVTHWMPLPEPPQEDEHGN